MGVVYTDREKCLGCYSCIRGCPSHAINVEQGLTQVVEERCVACGACLKICAPGARQAESDAGTVWDLLTQCPDVIAVLSSSFPAAFPGVKPGQLVTAIRKLGFSEVMEDAFGAELVGREYNRLLSEERDKSFISSNCPAVVLHIEKYHPQLIGNLAPVVSPMIAMGRLIKQIYNPRAKVIFICPCVAAKVEGRDENAGGVVDAVLTFAELKKMFSEKGISPENEPEGEFSGPTPNLGRLFAISGGLLRVTGLSDDILQNDVISAHGGSYVVRILGEFARGEIDIKFINAHFCHGCVDAAGIDNDLSGFRRKELVADYARNNADPARTGKDVRKYGGIDLSRRFTNRNVRTPIPEEEKIQKILRKIGTVAPDLYRMDCSACGYDTCQELAVAIGQGLAEIEMCSPYVLHRLRSAQEDLIQAEKLTSLGQLAASIAHEVNNPLAGVLTYTRLLAKKIAGGDLVKETALGYLSKMESELSRSGRLIRSLLDFARQTPPSLRPVAINDVVEKALELTAHSAELQNIQITKELGPSLPVLMADFDQLQQVCTNLALNAIQAMPEGGRLTLRTSTGDSWIRVEVEDTGCGIPQENIRKLFTPFFTTKGKVKGVGLGLPVAYGIVKRHGGRIEVESKENQGTTFTVHLPEHHEEKE